MKILNSYIEKLSVYEKLLSHHVTINSELFKQFEKDINSISKNLVKYESELDEKELRLKQCEFREKTNDFFLKGYFFERSRNWPEGYPGDYQTLENFYHGMPVVSSGIGMYLDNYSATRGLARGIRERKRMLRALLISELNQRDPHAKILNIACGSSREIFEIGPKINRHRPVMIYLDYDENALTYSKNLLFNADIAMDVFTFRKFNALKFSNLEYTAKEFDKQDIIYSAGLFDYIKDDLLIKILTSLCHLLQPEGVLIAPFKNSDNYETFDYHWLSNWSHFYQRSIADVLRIFEDVRFEGCSIKVLPSESPLINFFIIRKQ